MKRGWGFIFKDRVWLRTALVLLNKSKAYLKGKAKDEEECNLESFELIQ